MKRVRVNFKTSTATKSVRYEKRNGRDVVIVPAATLPDDVVMNDISYPAAEIEASYKTLNRTPAPLGHPTINGKFVSARDPEGINIGWIGAWNENLRRENGRVFMDKVIDVEMANRSEGGKAVLEAIKNGTPIHTSTGLLANLEDSTNDKFKFVARNIQFDHDAILLNDTGAATPEQGVGMLVNSATGEQEEIEVINSAYEDADRDLDWAVQSAISALQKRERAPIVERMKAALAEAFAGIQLGNKPTTNKEEPMPVDEKQFNDLSAKVDTIAESLNKVGETVANAVASAMKPLIEAQETLANAQKAKDAAEKVTLVETVSNAKLLTKELAEGTPLETLRALANNLKPKKAMGLNNAFGGVSNDDEFDGVDLNANIDAKKEA